MLTAANQAWVSDITYLRVNKDFVYLFLITDAYSRKITGWSLSDSLAIKGATEALKMAIKQCPQTNGVIHHSDRGIQYCCKEYVQLLKNNNMIISMTEENHCYENSVAERVNGILKGEFLLDEKFQNKEIALKAVKEAINTYNTKRPHWSLSLFTPEQVHKAAQKSMKTNNYQSYPQKNVETKKKKKQQKKEKGNSNNSVYFIQDMTL